MDEPTRLKHYFCHRRGCNGELVWDGVAWVCERCGLEIIYTGEIAKVAKNVKKKEEIEAKDLTEGLKDVTVNMRHTTRRFHL